MSDRLVNEFDFSTKKQKFSSKKLHNEKNMLDLYDEFDNDSDELDEAVSKFVKKIKQNIHKTTKLKT